MIKASAQALKAIRRKWASVLLVLGGAGTCLSASFQPLVDSPLVCCPRLMGIPGLDSRTLSDSIPLLIPVVSLGAALRLIVTRDGGPSMVRGVLLATGIAGAALILQDAGGLIAVKGGVPASGALLGFAGALLILAAAFLWPETRNIKTDHERPTRTLRAIVPAGILLGAGMLVVAVLMPWSDRPHPMRLVWLLSGPYWIWSTVLEAAIILPTIVAAVRLILADRQRPTEVGVALGCGLFATLLFVQVIGLVLSSSFPEELDLPPVFSLATGGYLGLGAGGLILASALVGSFSLRR
jgi:hypothetical protein